MSDKNNQKWCINSLLLVKLTTTLYFTIAFNMDLRNNILLWFSVVAINMTAMLYTVKRIHISKYLLAMIAFLAWGASSYFWSGSKAKTAGFLQTQIQIVVMLLSISSYVLMFGKIRDIMDSIIIALLLNVVYLMFVYDLSMVGSRGFVLGIGTLGIYWAANATGPRYACGAILSLYLILESELFIKRVLYLVCLGVFSIITVFTGSRGSFIMLGIGIMVFIVTLQGKHYIKSFLFVAIILLILPILIQTIPAVYDTVGFRLLALVGEEDARYKGTDERIELIEDSIHLFKENPALGIGADAFSQVTNRGYYSHNSYTELLSGLGIIGFVIYFTRYAILLMSILKMSYIHHNEKCFFVAIIISILFNNISAVNYSNILFETVLCLSFVYADLSIKMDQYMDNSNLQSQEIRLFHV